MAKLNFLSNEVIEYIHQVSLRILDEIGVCLPKSKACEILTDAGARADGERIFIPPELVEDCIEKTGKRVSLRGRGGIEKTLGDGSLYFHNLGGAPQVYYPRTRTRRSALLQDVRDATVVLDALENCHTITPFFTPTEVPGGIMSLAMYRHTLPHTIKAVQGPGVQYPREVKYAVMMAEVVGPPQEILTLALSPVSPLTIPEYEADAIIEIAKMGIAFAPLPCPTAGTTAPFSLTGAISQQNAEILFCLVLAELVRPGLPIIYCGRLAMMEPRTGLSVWGGIELGLASAVTVQIGHRYGLPVNVYGFSTNSHCLDAQNGFERAMNAILPALGGADELSGIGEMEAGVMGSFAQMVLDNELAGSIQRVMGGIESDPDILDVIASAMSSTHNFLTQRHTMKWIRKDEIFITKLAERGSWENWIDSSHEGAGERAQAEAERILREHIVPPLDITQEKELDGLLSAANDEIQ